MGKVLTLKRLLLIAAAIGFVLGIGIAALPFLMGSDLIRKAIEQAVRETGRSVAVPGPARIGLWPKATVEFDNVEISGPAPERFPFASVSTLRVSTTVGSLLRRRPEVKEIVLLRPIIQLTVDHAGDVNFAGRGLTDAEEQGMPRLIVDDGEIRFRDARTGSVFEASDADLTLAMPDASLDVKGHLTWRQRRVEFTAFVRSPAKLATEGSPADITLAAPELVAAFSGRAMLKGGLSLAGQVEASSTSLTDLAAWSGFAFEGVNGFKDFSLAGALDLRGSNLRAKDASLSLDGMNAEGEFSLLLEGPRPKVVGKLTLDRLDLNRFMPAGGKGQSLTQGWRDSPIDVTALRSVDATLGVEAGEIAFGDLRTGPATVKATLDRGVLDAEFAALTLYDGSGRGRVELDGSGKGLSMRAALEAEKVDMRALLRDFAGLDALSGAGVVSLSLSSRGATQLELISTLTGSVRALVADGAVETVDLRGLVEAAAAQPVKGWGASASRQTPFSSLEMQFGLSDGVADVLGWKLSGPDLAAQASGSVDMLRQRVDAQATVRADGRDVRLVVEGPWVSPTFVRSLSDMKPKTETHGKASRLTGEEPTSDPPVARP